MSRTNSYFLQFTAANSDFATTIQPVLKINSDVRVGYSGGELVDASAKVWEIALHSIKFTNIVHNVSAALGNNTLTYNNGVENKNVV